MVLANATPPRKLTRDLSARLALQLLPQTTKKKYDHDLHVGLAPAKVDVTEQHVLHRRIFPGGRAERDAARRAGSCSRGERLLPNAVRVRGGPERRRRNQIKGNPLASSRVDQRKKQQKRRHFKVAYTNFTPSISVVTAVPGALKPHTVAFCGARWSTMLEPRVLERKDLVSVGGAPFLGVAVACGEGCVVRGGGEGRWGLCH